MKSKRFSLYFKNEEELSKLINFSEKRGFSSTGGYLKYLFAQDKQKHNEL